MCVSFFSYGACSGCAKHCVHHYAHPTCRHPDATEDPLLRLQAFSAGANMVTDNSDHMMQALQCIAIQELNGALSCHWCGMSGLSAKHYWHHAPLYHTYADNIQGICNICGK